MVHVCFPGDKGFFDQVWSWFDLNCSKYNLSPIVIDPPNREKRELSGKTDAFPPIYSTYEDAYKVNPDLQWIWMDSSADIYLDEFDHPKDNAVYAIGHEIDGFSGEFPGIKVKIRFDETYGPLVLPMLLYDRWLYLEGKR
jgi:hypothetical protein